MNLKAIFESAWGSATIAFASGRVGNERTLQAFMFKSLAESLPAACILCEPRMALDGRGYASPDIVVIEDKQITAIVELKFKPDGYPVFESDLDKLNGYRGAAKTWNLLRNPETGKFGDPPLSIARNCLFVFGVIGKHDAWAVNEANLRDQCGIPAAHFMSFVLAIGQPKKASERKQRSNSEARVSR